MRGLSASIEWMMREQATKRTVAILHRLRAEFHFFVFAQSAGVRAQVFRSRAE
jgi:hypothetical protein